MSGELFSSVFLLLLVLDPLGNMPFVLSLLRNIPQERRPRIILRECAIATFVLVGFLFVGVFLVVLVVVLAVVLVAIARCEGMAIRGRRVRGEATDGGSIVRLGRRGRGRSRAQWRRVA